MFKKELRIIFIGLSMVIAVLVLSWVVFIKSTPVVPVQAPAMSNNEIISDDVEDDDVKDDETADWNVYRNEEYGFEVKYPEEWTNKNSESVILFSENGPIGDRFGFRAVEKNMHGNPFWFNIYCISNVKNVGELEYFDFVHSGDIVYYDDYDIIEIGAVQEEFFKVKEKTGSFIAYIKIKNENYFQISYHDSKIGSLHNKTNQILSTFKFINP